MMSQHRFRDCIPNDSIPTTAGARSPTTSEAVTAATHADLAALIVGSQPLTVVLRRIADLAAKTIPGADDASVMLIERGRPKAVAFTGRLGPTLDERQYEAGFGPCLTAAATGQMILLDTHNEHGGYPEFARQARRHGIRQVLTVGMGVVQRTGAALSIYSCDPAGVFDPQMCQVAASFAEHAAVTLFNAALYAGAIEEVAQLQQAMASRAGIEQAKGIIMNQQRCTAEEAFALLGDASGRSNRKLRDVAQTVIHEATSAQRLW